MASPEGRALCKRFGSQVHAHPCGISVPAAAVRQHRGARGLARWVLRSQ